MCGPCHCGAKASDICEIHIDGCDCSSMNVVNREVKTIKYFFFSLRKIFGATEIPIIFPWVE